MSRKLAVLVLLLLAAGPSVAAAQTKFELTPYWGYRLGSNFEDNDYNQFELDKDRSWGLILGYNLNRHFQLEFLWSRQQTVLSEEYRFENLPLFDLDVDYYHVGVAYEFGSGQARPFAALSLGFTEFDPQDPYYDNDTRFSVGLGGGVKMMFGRHLGLRLEARGFATDTASDRCGCHDDEGDLLQVEGLAGVVLAF